MLAVHTPHLERVSSSSDTCDEGGRLILVTLANFSVACRVVSAILDLLKNIPITRVTLNARGQLCISRTPLRDPRLKMRE